MGYLARHKVLRRALWALLAIILIAFLVIHFYLNTWVLGYVNGVLSNVTGYPGSVQTVDLDLYRGAYTANKLVINKKDGDIPVPFVSIEKADFSIQWKALLHGRVVASVTLDKPVINFAVKDDAKQTGTEVDWTQPIKQLVPIDINYVDFKDGEISYKDFSSTPQVDIFIHHMQGQIGNLRNVENPNVPLPSTVNISGDSIGNGQLKIKGHLNILKPVPDMNLDTQLENVGLTAMNTYTDAYGAFTFKDGSLDLYSQLGVKDSRVTGYVKLLAHHITVNTANTESPLQTAWSTVVAGVIKLFTNPTQDQFATRADLDGNLSNINTDTWSALATIIDNAFVSALHRGLDSQDQSGTVKNTDEQKK